MSGVKRMLEDVAGDVETLMATSQMGYEMALKSVLKDRQIIKDETELETIAVWDENISHMVA